MEPQFWTQSSQSSTLSDCALLTVLTVDVCQTPTELKAYYLKIRGKTESDLTEKEERIFTEYQSQRDGDGDGTISWPEMWSVERTRNGSLVQMILKTQKEREQEELEKRRKKGVKPILKIGNPEKEQSEIEKENFKERERQAFTARRKRWQAWDDFHSYEDEDALREIFNEHIETSEQVTNLVYSLSLILFNIGDSGGLDKSLGFESSSVGTDS